MAIKKTLLTVAVLFTAVSAFCAEYRIMQPSQSVESANTFALNLYKKVAGDGNIILSPYGVYTAFAMLYEGAAGYSLSEFREVFGFGEKNSAFSDDIKRQMQTYRPSRSGYGLFLANSLWINSSFSVYSSYKKTSEEDFGSEITPLKFSKASSVYAINKRASKNTADKIRDLIPAGTLNDGTKLVLVNASYFKAKWQNAFVASKTVKDDFYIGDGAKVKADIMYQRGRFGYREDNKIQILKMKYAAANSNFSMTVILPKENNILTAENYLLENGVKNIDKTLEEETLIVYFPKFESVWKSDIAGAMRELGIKSSDYSKISKNWLALSNVFHGSFVKVDEEGAETVSAGKTASSFREEPPAVFRADHPFMYVITDDSDGKIIFIGKMINPSAQDN